MQLRSREVKLRLLDKPRIKAGKTIWQLINVAGPVLIVILAGIMYSFFRKRKYTRVLILDKLTSRNISLTILLVIVLVMVLLFRGRTPFGKGQTSFASDASKRNNPHRTFRRRGEAFP